MSEKCCGNCEHWAHLITKEDPKKKRLSCCFAVGEMGGHPYTSEHFVCERHAFREPTMCSDLAKLQRLAKACKDAWAFRGRSYELDFVRGELTTAITLPCKVYTELEGALIAVFPNEC